MKRRPQPQPARPTSHRLKEILRAVLWGTVRTDRNACACLFLNYSASNGTRDGWLALG